MVFVLDRACLAPNTTSCCTTPTRPSRTCSPGTRPSSQVSNNSLPLGKCCYTECTNPALFWNAGILYPAGSPHWFEVQRADDDDDTCVMWRCVSVCLCSAGAADQPHGGAGAQQAGHHRLVAARARRLHRLPIQGNISLSTKRFAEILAHLRGQTKSWD